MSVRRKTIRRLTVLTTIIAIGAAIGPNDQFFFYATDHGGHSNIRGGAGVPGGGGAPPIPGRITPTPMVPTPPEVADDDSSKMQR